MASIVMTAPDRAPMTPKPELLREVALVAIRPLELPNHRVWRRTLLYRLEHALDRRVNCLGKRGYVWGATLYGPI